MALTTHNLYYIEYLNYAVKSDRVYTKMDVSKWLDVDGLHTLNIFVKSTETLKSVLATAITIEYL